MPREVLLLLDFVCCVHISTTPLPYRASNSTAITEEFFASVLLIIQNYLKDNYSKLYEDLC
jgi:hypothetical protein